MNTLHCHADPYHSLNLQAPVTDTASYTSLLRTSWNNAIHSTATRIIAATPDLQVHATWCVSALGVTVGRP